MKILATSEDSVTASWTWQMHMKRAIRDVESLLSEVDLSSAFRTLPAEAKKFPVFVPRPFLSRIEPRNAQDPLLRQVLPVPEEGQSPSHYKEDPLGEKEATVRSGLLKKYRSRVLVIASAFCAVNCRYCFRRHYPYQTATLGDSRWVETLE
ncbi:MAG: EF-P beta-lysylation protein EpmB, partial [Planctomycetota bacterium]